MNPKYTDPHEPLHFSRAKLGRKFFLFGLFALAMGALILYLARDYDTGQKAAGYFVLAIGFALCLYEMHRHFHPGKPLLSLAPDGVRFRIDLVKELYIPWHEVKAVRKIDVTDVTGRWPFQRTFRNVTALVVTADYYERHLDVGNAFLRGPGWGNLFVPDEKNNVMQMALHDGVLPASNEEIHAAVETRWKAFRDQARPKAKTP
jgi:hypothetical protein